jgi:hypothetical protein
MPPLTPFLYVVAICLAASGYLIAGVLAAVAGLALHGIAAGRI